MCCWPKDRGEKVKAQIERECMERLIVIEIEKYNQTKPHHTQCSNAGHTNQNSTMRMHIVHSHYTQTISRMPFKMWSWFDCADNNVRAETRWNDCQYICFASYMCLNFWNKFMHQNFFIVRKNIFEFTSISNMCRMCVYVRFHS